MADENDLTPDQTEKVVHFQVTMVLLLSLATSADPDIGRGPTPAEILALSTVIRCLDCSRYCLQQRRFTSGFRGGRAVSAPPPFGRRHS